MAQNLTFHTSSFGMYICHCGQTVSWHGDHESEHVCGESKSVVWLSFSGDEGYIGAIFVDAASVDDAALAIHMSLGLNPGGEMVGVLIPYDEVPPDKLDLMKSVPRMTLHTKDDLLALGFGPLVKASGELLT